MRRASSDGLWVVDLISLTATGRGRGRDGEWLRVRHFGYFVAEVRAWEDLARFLDIDDLQPVTRRDSQP